MTSTQILEIQASGPITQESLKAAERSPLLSWEAMPPIRVTEKPAGFQIVVPVGEIDLRQIWIFATSRAISIEIRSRKTVAHGGSACKETDDQRVVRELKLPEYILRGSTSVRPLGSDLEITCSKAPNEGDTNWTEMLRFDTRASLGCIQRSVSAAATGA